MNHSNPNEALEVANVRLRLRRGLKFKLHEYGGQPSYVIQERTASGYFQLGIPEYAFVSLLDGKTTVQEAVQQTSGTLGEEAFTIRDAIGTCQWLLKNGLADAVDQKSTAHASVGNLFEQLEENQKAKRLAQANPLFLKLPIGDPEPIIRKIAPMFGWIASRAFLVVWIVTMAVAGYFLFQSSDGQSNDGLASATQSLFTSNAWLWLIVTFVGMKIIHEFAHGLFCLRFGGRVPETGFVFILFLPIPYVDVTSCWGLASKWQRIAVSAAGMYVEMFVAAIAAIAWSLTHDPIVKFHLFNVMLTGSLTTILFNANFLMRFDGYYILSDVLEIPNLSQSGQQYLRYLGKRYLLGMSVKQPRWQIGAGVIIRCYGVAAMIWRIFICISLSIVASALLYGFGIALAILGIVMWVGLPAYRLFKMFFGSNEGSNPKVTWLMCVTTPIAVAAIGALFVIPWPFQVSAPAIVQYEDPEIVRAQVSGFIREVHVDNGSVVNQGDILLTLENKALVTERQSLEAAQGISIVRSRRHHSNRDIPAYQSEIAVREALEKQIEELKRREAQLVIRATRDGGVIAGQIESLLGQHVVPGIELLKIVDESKKEVILAISQRDFLAFESAVGNAAVFSGRGSVEQRTGVLVSVEPNANSTTDLRLTSYANGPLAVRPASYQSQTPSNEDSVELVYPRFVAVLDFVNQQNDRLRPGTIGSVKINRYPHPIATHFVIGMRHWIVDNVWEARQ